MKVLRLVMIFTLVALVSFGALCGKKKEPIMTPPKPEEPMEKPAVVEETVPEIEPIMEEPEALEPLVFKNIFFDFNKYNLKPEARETLRGIADKMRERPGAQVRIEGHCDERGTEQYNLALGEKRAMEAKKFLVSAGINGNRIDIISYGEERPADPRHNEQAWAKNRRDEFKVLE